MSTVRPFVEGDAPAVANLFMRVFRHSAEPASPSLGRYLVDVYLDNPWFDDGRSSLVAADDSQRVVGFLGALPMPLLLRGQPVAGVIGGSFMVDRELGDALTAVRLLRRFLAGGQDLALTDTANPVALQFWQRLGGRVAPFQAMRWILPIRPAGFALAMATRDGRRHRLRAAEPLTRLVDWFPARRLRPREDRAELRQSSVAGVYEVIGLLADHGQLGFGGTLAEFEWLVGMIRRKTQFGPLEVLTLHTGPGAASGAALYFPNRRGLGQLVTATVDANHVDSFVAALRRHADLRGSAAIMGHADARLGIAMQHLPCVYVFRNDFTVLHSRDPALLQPLCSGDVSMTRLTGEWWTRFQGDVFE